MPWSACGIVGPLRVLLSTAMLTALLTSAVSAVVEKARASRWKTPHPSPWCRLRSQVITRHQVKWSR
ncbi:hypothetical protein PJI17_16110 [Mycobacterium kansasii]